MDTLKGREAVITGGANGLGLSIAKRFAAAGANITIIDLPGTEPKACQDWRVRGIDLSKDSAADELARVAAELAHVDIVVANAGIVPPWRSVTELDLDEWDRVMRINVWGVAATIGAFAHALRASARSSVIAMASLNGHKAHADQMLYTASKHAVVGIVRAAAKDLGRHGVRVNALAPGPVQTDALLKRVKTRHERGGPSPSDAFRSLAEDTAMGRIATSDEVASAALFLASDASGGLTGTVLPVDGGLG